MGENIKRQSNHHQKKENHLIKLMICLALMSFIIILLSLQSSPFTANLPANSESLFSSLWQRGNGGSQNLSMDAAMITRLKDLVTFLPLKDIRFDETAMTGNTWFMSSFNDTREENEAEYMYFPSESSKGRLLCIKGNNSWDGTRNAYALAWRESLPDSAIFMEGLTFISDVYFNYENLWHGISALAPFVRWSMKNGCLKPTRWVLFHWGEVIFKMGSWLEKVAKAYFGDVKIDGFRQGEGPYCFEKALVMRHDTGSMGDENRVKTFNLLRCKGREYCGLKTTKRQTEMNQRGIPIIRFTLLLRKGARSFKNDSAVITVFTEACESVEGCFIKVTRFEDLSFCEQVEVMSNTDLVASPHGAQLTNMFFMDHESSIMEFFPRGWLELAGPGQYAHHWLANMSRMKHRGAWWDPIGKEDCPTPADELQCFLFHKDGQLGHNSTHFLNWTKEVLLQVRHEKQLANKIVLELRFCINFLSCLPKLLKENPTSSNRRRPETK